ncbi:hypothetical protein NL676_028334 [Syzygium grande]|nr:hypothetical protein NL676_028334 [Syzygium grande]
MLTANRSKLREALMEGFEVNYTNPYEDECARCGGIGGECGFDSDLGKPICICGDQICSTSTAVNILNHSLGMRGKSQMSLGAALGLAGACLAGLLVGFGIFSSRQKRTGGAFAIGASISAIAIKNKKDRGVEGLIGIHGSLAPRRYRYTDLTKMTNSFSEKLGQGGFGAVYKGKIKDDCLVAVKILTESKKSAVSTLGMRGTVGFIAPEVVFRNLGRVSHKSDVYSYGMLVLDMVGFRSSDIKFSNSSEMYFPEWIYRNLEAGKELKLPMNVTEEEEVLARKMIIVSLWCIQTSPSDRPPIVKVIEMLEGSFQSLQMPPKPILYSPSRSLSQHWEMTTSTSYGSREEDRILENLEESNN